MEIQSKTYLVVEKGDHKFQLVLNSDAPLGLVFDALMEMKGFVVDKMVASQAEEEKEAEEKMGVEEAPVSEES